MLRGNGACAFYERGVNYVAFASIFIHKQSPVRWGAIIAPMTNRSDAPSAVHKANRKGIYILPNLFTLAALFGGFFAIFPSITADLFGAKNLSMNYGILFTSYGVAAFIGPRLAARVKELNNGDYSIAFLAAAIMCSFAIILTLFARRRASR